MNNPEDQPEQSRWKIDGSHLFVALLFALLVILAIFPELLIWPD